MLPCFDSFLNWANNPLNSTTGRNRDDQRIPQGAIIAAQEVDEALGNAIDGDQDFIPVRPHPPARQQAGVDLFDQGRVVSIDPVSALPIQMPLS